MSDTDQPEWLLGGGEMGALVRAKDWSETPLGPRTSWPHALRTAIAMTLDHAFPQALLWGPQRCLLYNDALRQLGVFEHPSQLGAPTDEWTVEPFELDETARYTLLERGQAIVRTDVEIPTLAGSVREHAFFQVGLSPVRLDDGGIGGVLVTLLETHDSQRERLYHEHDLLETMLAELPVQAAIIRGHDLRFVYVNAAFAAIAPGRSIVGRTVEEAWPEAAPSFAERCRHVLRTGEVFRVLDEPYELLTGEEAPETRYFSWAMHRVSLRSEPGTGLVSVVWETTDRKRTEEVRREHDERQRYLLHLADALRGLTDPEEILAVASRHLGRHLKLNRVMYGSVDEHAIADVRCDYTDGLPPLNGRIPLVPLGAGLTKIMERGDPLVMDDIETDPRLTDAERVGYRATGVAAYIAVGLIKDGAWVGALGAHCTSPRQWRPLDSVLVQETAERTWSALARAEALQSLRRSEERQAFLLGVSDAIRRLSDPTEIQTEAATLLRRHLDADRVVFALLQAHDLDEVRIDAEDHAADLPPLRGSYRAHELGAWTIPGSVPRVCVDVLADRELDERLRAAHGAMGCAAFLAVTIRDGDRPVAILAVHQRTPRTFGDDDLALAMGTAERAWSAAMRATAEQAVQRNERRVWALIEGIPQLVWQADNEGHYRWASPQWTELTGLSLADSEGLGWLAAVHPDDRFGAVQAWATAMSSGRLEMEIRLYDAVELRYRWFRTRATPVRDGNGRIVEWLGTSTDVDELRRLRDHQEVLVGELQHRTRNLMGVVDAIARETIQYSSDLESFEAGFRQRIGALSRAQSLLSRTSESERVSFDMLLRSEIEAMFCSEHRHRVALDGPTGVLLRSSSVQILALALHELATNAIKHGALSRAEGTLSVKWWIEPEQEQNWLHIEWRERGLGLELELGGTPAHARGQGRMLIERKLPYQLDAKTSWALTPDGVHSTIAVPFPPQRTDTNHAQGPRPTP